MKYYHGTVDAFVNKIKREGLRGSTLSTHTNMRPAIFITDHKGQAWVWARAGAAEYADKYGKKTAPVVLEISAQALRGTRLVPDILGWEEHDFIVVGKDTIEPQDIKILRIGSNNLRPRKVTRRLNRRSIRVARYWRTR